MSERARSSAAGAALVCLLASSAGPAAAQDGQSVYEIRCAACHRTGLLGAPRVGEMQDWEARLGAGRDALVARALEGVGKMPPKGGNPGLDASDVAAAVDHMLATLDLAGRGSGEPGEAGTSASDRAIAKPAAMPPPRKVGQPAKVNAFNRLMRPPSERNPPPAKDGIHDPAAPGTRILQPPRESFASLPRSVSGNRVDWVRALGEQRIAPRFDLHDPNKSPVVMDLNIVREVKGSMPDVVYPHRQHTEWLDCSNCHTSIFIPKKGANEMSMAGILLGQGCGVCHGKVAFPVAECRRCHSRDKPKGGAE